MNIVMITTGMRPDLLVQSLESAATNASDWASHDLTLVIDGHDHWMKGEGLRKPLPGNVLINTSERVGASRVRNIGAGSIPRYRRQEHVLFLDDDVYMCKDWDLSLWDLATNKNLDFPDLNYPRGYKPNSIISGYSHPYNQCSPGRLCESYGWREYGIPLVISSVAMMMPWSVFDDVGPWDEPGGAGASEDYALCMRAKDKGYGFAVTNPQCVIHCGLMSSKGEQIVGYNELAEQNDKLLDLYRIRGKVVFG